MAFESHCTTQQFCGTLQQTSVQQASTDTARAYF